ncbi:YhbY family RNA-binding protein [Gemmatimonadota bacterium Y43]
MTRMKLTSKQRAFLRSKAHGLKPVVHIGTAGLTDAAIQSLLDAFNTRELLKVRVQEGAPDDAWETADRIVERLDGVSVAQTIGKVMVLYRPFPDGPELKLPG